MDKVEEKKEIKKPTPKKELETIKNQYKEAINQQQQYANLAQRCLGAIEILERMIEDEDK